MAVGSNFARAKDEIGQHRSIPVLLLYSCMTPFGIGIGMILTTALEGVAASLVEAIALGVASGSFIYLAFHEISDDHAQQPTSAASKLGLFSLGLVAMAILATWT